MQGGMDLKVHGPVGGGIRGIGVVNTNIEELHWPSEDQRELFIERSQGTIPGIRE